MSNEINLNSIQIQPLSQKSARVEGRSWGFVQNAEAFAVRKHTEYLQEYTQFYCKK